MRIFSKMEPSQICKITLLSTDISKSCPSHKLLMLQICPIMLLAKQTKNLYEKCQYYMEYYTIIDFNEVDIRIYLPEKVIIHRGS